MKQTTFQLRPAPDASRANCAKFLWLCPNGWLATFKPPTRSNIQNAKMHSVLAQLVKANVKHHGRRMDVEAWKDVLAASLLTRAEIDANTVPIPDSTNGYVVIGLHTSDLTPAQVSEIIERAYCIGAQNDPPVRFMEDIQPSGRMKCQTESR